MRGLRDIVHLAIDYPAARWMRSYGISRQRAEILSQKGRALADVLWKKGIATVVVAHDPFALPHAPVTGMQCGLKELRAHRWDSDFIPLMEVRGHEFFFVKSRVGLFSERLVPDEGREPCLMRHFLSGRGVTRLIMTGMHTSRCVHDAIKGAQISGFCVWPLYDVMEDAGCPTNDPLWHKEKLQEQLGDNRNVCLETREGLLQSLDRIETVRSFVFARKTQHMDQPHV